jgi:glycine cleavage system H lipoate-binding protein
MEEYYLNDDDYDEGVPSITAAYNGENPSVVDRYFTRFYHKKQSANGDNEDHLVLYHTNKLCLIGLAKSHIALAKGIVSINYKIGNSDRSLNVVKGKHKKGGMNLQPDTALALVTCKDGSEYKVFSCITSRLLETNERLESNPDKLAIEGTGYIAVVQIKPENCEKIKSSLTSHDDYTE